MAAKYQICPICKLPLICGVAKHIDNFHVSKRETLCLSHTRSLMDQGVGPDDEAVALHLRNFGDVCDSLTEEEFRNVYMCPACIYGVLYKAPSILARNLSCPQCGQPMRSGKEVFEQVFAGAIPKEPGC